MAERVQKIFYILLETKKKEKKKVTINFATHQNLGRSACKTYRHSEGRLALRPRPIDWDRD